MQAANGLV